MFHAPLAAMSWRSDYVVLHGVALRSDPSSERTMPPK